MIYPVYYPIKFSILLIYFTSLIMYAQSELDYKIVNKIKGAAIG